MNGCYTHKEIVLGTRELFKLAPTAVLVHRLLCSNNRRYSNVITRYNLFVRLESGVGSLEQR